MERKKMAAVWLAVSMAAMVAGCQREAPTGAPGDQAMKRGTVPEQQPGGPVGGPAPDRPTDGGGAPMGGGASQ